MKKLLMMTVLGLAVAAPAAMANDKSAAEMQKKTDEWFAKADTNGDGAITPDEHEAAGESKFSAADADGNGSISKEELASYKAKEHAKK